MPLHYHDFITPKSSGNAAIGKAVALGFLFLLNRLKVHNLIPYLIGGVVMWYFMLNSGVHATITGVLLAFVIPFGNGDKKTASSVLQHFLHKPVAFIILPIFALANTAIVLSSDMGQVLSQNYSLGIALGLIVGKPLGIFLFSFLAVAFGFCKLPSDLNWKSILGVGFLGGIGFTMSIFVGGLAFADAKLLGAAKLGILAGSAVAALLGLGYGFAMRKRLQEVGKTCVFSEPPLRPRLAETLSAGLPVRLAELDALGVEAGSYEQLLEALAGQLAGCLEGL